MREKEAKIVNVENFEQERKTIKEAVRRIVNPDKDFVIFRGRDNSVNVEITRNFALKINAMMNLNYQVVDYRIENEEDGSKTYIVKVRVEKDGKYAEGLGICNTREFQDVSVQSSNAKRVYRALHDALAIAETRALKRAIEVALGLPLINDIIEELFKDKINNRR
ncbi:MAG: hypothetical protein ABIL45_04200 [candidate division WOR-3 bacterium]